MFSGLELDEWRCVSSYSCEKCPVALELGKRKTTFTPKEVKALSMLATVYSVMDEELVSPDNLTEIQRKKMQERKDLAIDMFGENLLSVISEVVKEPLEGCNHRFSREDVNSQLVIQQTE